MSCGLFGPYLQTNLCFQWVFWCYPELPACLWWQFLRDVASKSTGSCSVLMSTVLMQSRVLQSCYSSSLPAFTSLSSFPGMSHCFKGVIHGRGWKCCMEVQVGSPLLCPFSASDQHQTMSCPALELGSHLHGAPGTQPQLAGLRSSQVRCCGR